MPRKIKTKLRDVSIPYRLTLDQETHLPPLSEFISSDDPDIKEIYWIHYTPVFFKNDELTINSHFYADDYLQQIKLNDDHLLVSCNCKSQVVKLCKHLIKLFTELNNRKEHNFFEQFKQYPYTDSEFYNKYLMITSEHYRGVRAVPKPEFGKIYKFGDQINIDKIFPLPVSIPPLYREENSESTSIVYVMCGLSYVATIPFLLPCLVKFKSNTDEVVNYIEFKEPENLSAGKNISQKALNGFSEDFNRLIGFNKTPREHREIENIDEKRLIAFSYWKCLIPTLSKKSIFYYGGFESKVNLKAKPKKSYMERISFSKDKADFAFTLEEFDGYFRLIYHASLNDNQVKIKGVYPYSSPFFYALEESASTYHQFNTLEEANIINEIQRAGSGFTILHQDLESFNSEVMSTLTIYYPVQFKFLSEPINTYLTIVEKRIVLEDHGHYVSFNPIAVYDNGSCFSVLSKGKANLICRSDALQILHRDEIAEEKFKTALIELHSIFATQSHESALYLSKDALTEDLWLARCQYLMPDATFVGLEKILDIKLHIGEPIITTDVSRDNDWFDITVKVKFGNETLSSEDIQKALKKRSPLIQLSNGKVAYLPDSFFTKLSKPFRNGVLTKKGIKIPGQHFTIIDKLYDKLAKPHLAHSISQTAQLFSEIENTPSIEIPENVNAILRTYQKVGFSWMTNLHNLNWGGLLADDMGLGKTLQVLTLLQYLKNNSFATAPHLLLAPTSLLFNWKEEAERFCPELNVLFFHGLAREKNIAELNKYDLILTSYGTSSVDVEFLMTMTFHYLILDEAQAIKNPYSQRYKTTMLIPAQNRLALTGTPVENSSTDLYALMNFVNPGFFGTLKMFKENLLPGTDDDGNERLDTISKMIRPFILRRTKKQVASDLPPKTEMILWCEMEAEQRKIYDDYRKRFKDNLIGRIDNDGLERSKFYVLEGLMKLRQICNSPLLMKDAPPFHGVSCKIKELMNHISENTIDHKLLVFSQFTSMLSIVRTQLDQNSISYSYLDGRTTPINRKKEVDNFQNDDTIKVFLISLKAGGVGLNLTSADYVYLLDPWWNPAKEDQAIDRCYRIGQDKHVMAYKVICKDTLEERILEMQQRKKRLANELVPTDESILKSMGKEEILGLLD